MFFCLDRRTSRLIGTHSLKDGTPTVFPPRAIDSSGFSHFIACEYLFLVSADDRSNRVHN
jgi:hypothetical protein